MDGGGDPEAIEDRVQQLRREIERVDSEWDREKLKERLAKLAGGVGVIKVGAATEVELKERKHRITRMLCPPPVRPVERASSPVAVPHGSRA